LHAARRHARVPVPDDAGRPDRTPTHVDCRRRAALSPLFAGLLFARPSLVDAPFYIAGTLKIAYDLLLFHAFRSVKPPEEATRAI